MDFMTALDNTLNTSITENGAKGFKTTKSDLLDMNFKVTSYRNCDETEIISDFTKAFNEDKLRSIKWLFYLRDVREGLGERRSFRIIMKYLSTSYPNVVTKLLPLISEYGRWDDLICLLNVNKELNESIMTIIKKTLSEDLVFMNEGKSVSLLAKWLPSENTSSIETVKMAKVVRRYLGVSPTEYRKTLSKLRSYIKVVEKDMSANNWENIDYSSVPSKANLIYADAFMKHDRERRLQFLTRVEKGEEKINSSVTYPHEIVHKYISGPYRVFPVNETLEALWKALPDFVGNNSSTIVVADGSGSMLSRIAKTNVTALDVANSLAIYFSERCKGSYKNKYITFSHNPRLVDMSKCTTLWEKIQEAFRYNEISDTNIEATFNLILNTALENNLTQEELPNNVLVISDMEFNKASSTTNKKLFVYLQEKFEKNGYKMPKLIFWNVCSRTKTIPLVENDMGVILVSGFSVNTLKMVMSNELDPYKALIKVLDSDRYKPIEKALKN